MKEGRTVTIKELLEEVEEKRRKDIISTFNSCMRSICANDLQWQNFEVYLPGSELMKIILESNAPEYLMTIADALLCNGELAKIVKIIVKRGSVTDFDTSKYQETVIATIVIANKDFKKMVTEI